MSQAEPGSSNGERLRSMEFDEHGLAIPGTFAISTVGIGGALGDGTPVAFINSATCDVCGGWASELWVARKITATDGSALTDSRISRVEHSQEIADALTDEFGGATNVYEPDELAVKVDDSARRYALDVSEGWKP